MRPNPRNTMAAGLTHREWNRLIAYCRTSPAPFSNPPSPDDLIHAATIAAGRKRRTPLPAQYLHDAQRVAAQHNASQTEIPQ